MTVRCKGDSWIMERVGEKQDFEAELSRLGLRHEDLVLHVRRGGLGGIDKGWGSHYAVRVTHIVTGNRAIYWGGTGENWVAQFAQDVARGIYRELTVGGALSVSVRRAFRPAGGNRT